MATRDNTSLFQKSHQVPIKYENKEKYTDPNKTTCNTQAHHTPENLGFTISHFFDDYPLISRVLLGVNMFTRGHNLEITNITKNINK